MTFPSYPEYKDSGVEWLRDVPKHWEAWKISRAFGKIGSGTTPTSSESKWYQDGEIPWITTGELRESLITDTSKKITLEALQNFSALQIHPKGSLAIAMYGATIGRLGILGVDATTNQACCVLSHPHKISIKFFYYWFQAFKQIIIDRFAYGGGQPNINQEIIASLRVAAPELEEQGQIVQFLDYETSKIDALIQEQQQLIGLLNEKRQTIISNAVCRGLDPKVPMKDSGVEWLGLVPEHWEIKSVKKIAKLDGGAGFPDDEQGKTDDPIPFFKVADLANGLTSSENSVSEEVARLLRAKIFPIGTIAFAKVGAALLLNRRVLMTISGCVDNNMMVAMCHPETSPYWLTYFLRTIDFVWFVNPGAVPSVNQEQIGGIRVPVPPASEQISIVNFLDYETAKIDELKSEAVKASQILQERRLALISAAVTGQIDVRHFQPKAS